MTTALIPIGVLAIAFALSAFLVPVAGWIARRFGILDAPGERKVHEVITPRAGGIAVWATFTLVVLAGYFGAPALSRLDWVAPTTMYRRPSRSTRRAAIWDTRA